MDTLPWAKFWNRTGYFLADECVSSSVNYFNSTWKQLVTFYGCWCSAAQLDQFNWSRLSSESRQKSLFSLNQWESYCQPQYGWECAVWISDNIYATIALKIHCVDGKFFIAWWKFKIFNIHHSFSFKSCNFFWYIYFLRMHKWLDCLKTEAVHKLAAVLEYILHVETFSVMLDSTHEKRNWVREKPVCLFARGCET